MSFSHANGLAGTLSALPHDLVIVRSDERGHDAEDDSCIQFERDMSGQVSGLKIQIIGSNSSFDAQDMQPKKSVLLRR